MKSYQKKMTHLHMDNFVLLYIESALGRNKIFINYCEWSWSLLVNEKSTLEKFHISHIYLKY